MPLDGNGGKLTLVEGSQSDTQAYTLDPSHTLNSLLPDVPDQRGRTRQ